MAGWRRCKRQCHLVSGTPAGEGLILELPTHLFVDSGMNQLLGAPLHARQVSAQVIKQVHS